MEYPLQMPVLIGKIQTELFLTHINPSRNAANCYQLIYFKSANLPTLKKTISVILKGVSKQLEDCFLSSKVEAINL